jgi:hypothetical protein
VREFACSRNERVRHTKISVAKVLNLFSSSGEEDVGEEVVKVTKWSTHDLLVHMVVMSSMTSALSLLHFSYFLRNSSLAYGKCILVWGYLGRRVRVGRMHPWVSGTDGRHQVAEGA